MTFQLIIPGRKEALEPFRVRLRGTAEVPPATDLLSNIEVVHAYNLSRPARSPAQSEVPQVVEVEDDDICEIEVEDGLTLWTSAARYQERVMFWRPEAMTERGLEFTGLPGPSFAERGVKEWFIGALRILRLKKDALAEQVEDPASWTDCVKTLALGQVEKAGAWATAKLLIYLIEKRLTPAPGLYRWASLDASAPLDLSKAMPLTANDLPKDKHILVFIHGTASSSLGSFGAFCNSDASQEWRSLRETFGEDIYVFEHRTMSESPIDNALALAECLPEGAMVSLVTHSRGGQVGDLLCLAVGDLGDARIDLFRRPDAKFDDADRHDKKQLKRLRDQLQQKHLRIMRVARVACPARGTLLASDNIDEFLSLLTNLIGYIPGLGQLPLYEVIKRVALQVARERTDPALIPGIEAMMPDSPLVALLNSATGAGGNLGVIAGDIEGGNWLKRIAVFITDRFIYDQRDNDLVVNTDSMFFGAKRDQEYYIFDQGSDVSHFNYFQNSRTRIKLAQWLLAPASQPPQGFTAFEREHIAPVPMLRALQTRDGAPQPVVFVLPGIMGSELEHNQDCVWLDYPDLMFGGLGKIKDISDDAIKATGLLGEYYGNLCNHLADTHRVLPFAYDWRKSIRVAAAALGKEVGNVLKNTTQPVRFLAHSMGGLVVRRFIADHADLWEEICTRPGSRFVMLGTPNQGSYAMVETLLGAAKTVRQLALLDLENDLQRVVDIIGGFQGALELLPRQSEDSKVDWYTQEVWQTLKNAHGNFACIPEAGLLAEAKSVVDTLPKNIPHADRVVYVAGSAPMTPFGAEIDERGLVVLSSTDAGDGRVTHKAGQLPGVATWYMPAEHGELADHKPAFPALVELLEQGKTTALPTTPPSMARGETRSLPYVPQPLLYPTRGELVAGFMGKPVRAYQRHEPVSLSVCVVHGDLRYASYPVMVGHYLGDTIVAAEDHLDRQLDRALSQRYQLGIYPGEPGTTAIVLRPQSELEKRLGIPRGAIVIGLGRMGDLGTGTLANAVRQGALQYALQIFNSTPRAADNVATQEIGLSSLLIGANSAAAISVEDSVGTMMRAVAHANRELERSRIPIIINRLEIIELFSDAATQAVHAACKQSSSVAQSLNVHIDVQPPELVQGRNGRLRRSQMPPPGQWRRWTVTAVPTAQAGTPLPLLPKAVAGHLKASLSDSSQVDPSTWRAVLDCAFDDVHVRVEPPCALRYVAIADRARTEVRVQDFQPELIEKYVQLTRQDSQFRAGIAHTLWELLLPNELKDGIGQLTRLVLEVDAETANYPWELMVEDGEPLCVKLGLVRQLETTQFRAQVCAASSNSAYVVGDPVTSANIPTLPGARAEASLVASLLANNGFAVEHNPERPDGLDVFNRLYAQPYRVLHLAGHGYYEASPTRDGKARSGMVLEGGLYLTAVEIAKMRHVPDFVFLNCCHLGQLGSEAKNSPSVAYNKLAASISRELIEMGVRAVIAAGWAVRDDAAGCFAKVFYTAMLDGETFGAALQQARTRTWEQYRECNTWGAYQAYGDPDFRLSTKNGDSVSLQDRQYASVEEALYELGSIWIMSQDLACAATDEVQSLKASLKVKLAALEKDCPSAWRTQGTVLYRFARAYSELGEFNTAIEYYRRALATDEEDSDMLFSAAEQLGNLEARLGRNNNDPAMIQCAIERFGHLIALGKTRERLALLGSAYKCQAQVNTERGAMVEALSQAAHYYHEAADIGDKRGQLDPYHALNWITLDALLGHKLPDAEAWLSRCEAAAVERYASRHKLWDAVALPDAEVARRLLLGELKTDAAEPLITHYRNVFTAAQATPREQESVMGQLKFIRKILDGLGGNTVSVDTIDAILNGLTRLPASTSASATPRKHSKSKGVGGVKGERKKRS